MENPSYNAFAPKPPQTMTTVTYDCTGGQCDAPPLETEEKSKVEMPVININIDSNNSNEERNETPNNNEEVMMAMVNRPVGDPVLNEIMRGVEYNIAEMRNFGASESQIQSDPRILQALQSIDNRMKQLDDINRNLSLMPEIVDMLSEMDERLLGILKLKEQDPANHKALLAEINELEALLENIYQTNTSIMNDDRITQQLVETLQILQDIRDKDISVYTAPSPLETNIIKMANQSDNTTHYIYLNANREDEDCEYNCITAPQLVDGGFMEMQRRKV